MDDFAAAARARRDDVRVLRTSTRDLAAVYMSGYVVECQLKALLQTRGRPFPRSGRAGHDLRALWSAAGFKLRDAGGNGGTFISQWTTSLRYRGELPASQDGDQLLNGAEAACALIARRQRAERTRRARKARRGS
jgi:hypothetical protein